MAGMMDRFHLFKYGLAMVLFFVALKIAWLNSWYGGKFPVAWSLGIITLVIAVTVVASLLLPKSKVATPSVAESDRAKGRRDGNP